MIELNGIPSERRRHSFFLNPYKDVAFTKCPRCEANTRIRKFPLVIHIDPKQLLTLNKTCRYCVECDLIIVRKPELESLIVASPANPGLETIGNHYLVIGVMERGDWQKGKKGKMTQEVVFDHVLVFKDVLSFEPVQAGWCRDNENQHHQNRKKRPLGKKTGR